MRIAIIGAGPAGLICALQLAKQGHDVTILEKKTSLTDQGSGLLMQTIGLDVLEHLGLRQEVELLGRRISYITGIKHPSGRKTIDIDYTRLAGSNYAVGIDRSSVWSVLYEQVRVAGIRLIKGVNITGLLYKSHVEVVPIGKERGAEDLGTYQLIVDASGAYSQLRDFAVRRSRARILQYGALWCSLNLPDDSPYNTDVMTLRSNSRNVGVGILPTGRSRDSGSERATVFFNVHLDDYPQWNDDTFHDWKNQGLDSWPDLSPLLDQLIQHDQIYVAKFMQHTLPHPFGDRIAFIGDSAHATSPLLGQGISHSMIDAITLPWALAQESDIETALKLYGKKRQLHVRIYQMLAKMFTPFYQSDNPVAIAARDALYPIVSELLLMKRISPYVLSGQIGRPTKSIVFK